MGTQAQECVWLSFKQGWGKLTQESWVGVPATEDPRSSVAHGSCQIDGAESGGL